MLDPRTVTLDDPVTARFTLDIPLNPDESPEKAAVTLPSRVPTLTDSVRLPRIPPLAWHSTDVSDFHVERSHAVYPICNQAVRLDPPMPAPSIVKLAEPDECRLVLPVALICARSLEYVSVLVPVRIPTVADSRRDASVP